MPAPGLTMSDVAITIISPGGWMIGDRAWVIIEGRFGWRVLGQRTLREFQMGKGIVISNWPIPWGQIVPDIVPVSNIFPTHALAQAECDRRNKGAQ